MRGGKRAGAGRKTKAVTQVKTRFAEEVLDDASFDQKDAWLSLLSATTTVSVAVIGGESGEREYVTVPDNRIRLDALKFLTEQRDGKAPQAITDPLGNIPTFRVLIEHIGTANSTSAQTK